MRLHFFFSFLVLGSLVNASWPIWSSDLDQSSPLVQCPAEISSLNPYEVPPYVALRFIASGHFIAPASPLAAYTAGEDRYAEKYDRHWYQLRFGQVYLIEGNNNEGLGRYPHSVTCIKGKDTMRVYVRPMSGWPSWLYDSIPFHPGRYELIQAPPQTIGLSPYHIPDSSHMAAYGLKQETFARYYEQHQFQLARANPFDGCHFLTSPPQHSSNPDGYVPATPADIFELLLLHQKYIKILHWKLRTLAKDERLPSLPNQRR